MGIKVATETMMLFLLAFGAMTRVAYGDSIGPTCASTLGGSTTGDSGSCLGSVYTLTSDFVAEDTTGGNTYDITLTIDTSGLTVGPAYIDAVAIGVNGATAVNLDQAPGGSAAWTTSVGGLNSGGCGVNMAAFVCAVLNSQISPPTPAPNGANSTYTWVFDVTVPGTLSTSSDVKALYYGSSGKNLNKNVGITSAGITIQPGLQEGGQPPAVPEPGSIALLGTALSALVVGSLMRRYAASKKSLGLST